MARGSLPYRRELWQAIAAGRRFGSKKGKPVNTFTAFYKSKKATKEKYEGGETIEITITPSKSVDAQPLKFNYQVKKEKRVGFLDKWQWLDHASEWSDDIRFERVKN